MEIENQNSNDWWQQSSTCTDFSNILKGYILGLSISGEICGKFQYSVFSGFLIEFNNSLFWFTAGHVIDLINDILNNQHKNLIGRWLDWEDTDYAESIPVSLERLSFFSGSPFGVDFGVYILSCLEKELIIHNKHSIAFTKKHYIEISDFEPEGFFLLGYPLELVHHKSNTKFKKQIYENVFDATLICLPVQQIPFSADMDFENKDPDAFYGQILDFPDSSYDPINIKGMSGGPIIAFRRDPTVGLDIRLIGIQSNVLKNKRQIQAIPIYPIMQSLSCE